MIKISRMADYAVVLMRTLALMEGRCSAASLAKTTGLPKAAVSNILKALLEFGLLTSQQGAMGGYALKHAIERVTVADIIEAIDGPIAMTDCNNGHCHQSSHCCVKDNWLVINQIISQVLRSVTLKEMSQPLSTQRLENVVRFYSVVPRGVSHDQK